MVQVSAEERFKSYMSNPNENGCILWMGASSERGYGYFYYKKQMSAHRASYLLFKGIIPTNQCVLHRCDKVGCVNPQHLFLGTQLENIQDRINKGRTKSARGVFQHLAKLNDTKVKSIKRMLAKKIPQKIIADKFGIGKSVITDINCGKTWKHVT